MSFILHRNVSMYYRICMGLWLQNRRCRSVRKFDDVWVPQCASNMVGQYQEGTPKAREVTLCVLSWTATKGNSVFTQLARSIL